MMCVVRCLLLVVCRALRFVCCLLWTDCGVVYFVCGASCVVC